MFQQVIAIGIVCFFCFSTLTAEAQEPKYLYTKDTVLKLKGSESEKKKALELKVGDKLASLSGGKCTLGETGVWTGNTFKSGCVLSAKEPWHLTYAVDATLLTIGAVAMIGGILDVGGVYKTKFEFHEWEDFSYYGVSNKPTDMGVAMWTTFGVAMGIEAIILVLRACDVL